MALDMGIDLGTASVLVFLEGKGVVLHEPSVVAIDQNTSRVLAVGEDARRMLGRTPGNIIAIRPLRDGVIADFDVTESMLKYFIKKAQERRRLFRPRVVVCVPGETTSVEQKAVVEAVMRTGARSAYLIEETRAAALGAGLEIFQPSGSMIIDIGGGTSDVAVISLGEVVVSNSVRVGGDKFDTAIIRYIKRKHNLLVGERTAEDLKIKVATVFSGNREESMEVRGRDLLTGLPNSVVLSSPEIIEALEDSLLQIIQSVRYVLERTPPELAGDIIDKGIILTGGGALLDGLDKRLAKETGVPVYLADDPVTCVARGTGIAIKILDKISPTLIASRGRDTSYAGSLIKQKFQG